MRLEFDGKQQVYGHHLTVPVSPLIPDYSESVPSADGEYDDGNLIIQGDNLRALKALMPRYAGRVKCVFIDPPYNTGNEGWVYNDNVNSPLMRKWLEDNKPVDGEDMDRHDKWASMMWPRLNALRDLLSDDGVIFVTIDDNEQAALRLLLDEIFGADNFVVNFIWQHRKSNQNDIDVSLQHNYVLCYAKSRADFAFNSLDIDSSDYSNPDNDPKGPWAAHPMDAPNIRANLSYEITNPNTGTVYLPPPGRCWRFSKDKFDEAEADGRIVYGKRGTSKPQYKKYLSEAKERGKNVSSIWDEVGTATNATQELNKIFESKGIFPTPKPLGLLERIVDIATNEDSVVLDSFAGSGTAAHAVLSLNAEDDGSRKFILVECEEYADRITAERVRRVISGVPSAKDGRLRDGYGGSFTFCTLGEPLSVSSMLSGESLPSFQDMAVWAYHTATGKAVDPSQIDDSGDGPFYRDGGRDFWLLYEPDVEWLRSPASALSESFADRVAESGVSSVVFASHKHVPQRRLSDMGIVFCQLPYGEVV